MRLEQGFGMTRPVANDDGVVSLAEAEVLVREIERLRAELDKLESRVDQLDELAHKDPLVHLPNRRSFIASLERLIARAERLGRPAAMLFVDVDGLKAINDTFGHRVGDEALMEISKLLLSSVRKTDAWRVWAARVRNPARPQRRAARGHGARIVEDGRRLQSARGHCVRLRSPRRRLDRPGASPQA